MAKLEKILSDSRLRILAALGVIAVAGAVFAGIALHFQNANTGAISDRPDLIPGLGEKLRHVAKIHVQSQTESFEVVFNPQKGWILPDRGNYPASLEEVRQTLVGLAGLEVIEAKTTRKDWLTHLGLDAPSKGNGVAITIFSDKNEKLASLILGKTSDIGERTGATGIFVRKPDSSESWLVRSTFVPHGKSVDWMDKNVLSLRQDRIRTVDVDPAGGNPFHVTRTSKDDQDFEISPLPAGRTAAGQQVTFSLTDALADFPFDNILPVAAVDFANADRVVFRTFDGLMVTVLTVKRDDGYWSSLEASPIPGMTKAEKEVRAISAHVHGWAYKLPSYKGAQFMPTLDSLLKPKATK